MITVQLPAPHSREQAILMNAFLTRELREIWFACGTKFGKTLGANTGLLHYALCTSNRLFRVVAPIYAQSKISLGYMEKLLPANLYKTNKSEPSLTIKNIGSKIEFWHGTNPESLEGEAVTGGTLLDEVAKMKPEVYDSVKTTHAQTRTLIAGFSTPKGKNHFYKRCMKAKAEMEWALKKGKPPKKIFITAPTRVNPNVSLEEIESNRRDMPYRLFRQYFEAEFVDDGDVFSGYRDCVYGEPLSPGGQIQKWFNKTDYQQVGKFQKYDVTVVVGADWGKTNDYCVFTAWDIQKKRMIAFMRFRKMKYTKAIKNLLWFQNRFTQCENVYHDKTGLGGPIDDALSGTGIAYEGITFTNETKTEMVNNLIIGFEVGETQVPDWDEMISELDTFEVQTTKLGKLVYNAATGFHDDIVCSMILGWHGVLEYADSCYEVSFVEDLKVSDFSRLDMDQLVPVEG